MPFSAGPKEAAKMLAQLDKASRDRILGEMEKKDPRLVALVKSLMVSLEDLKFITVKMLQEFLREISIKDLGLALRRAEPDLQKSLLQKLSSSLQKDIVEILKGPPQSLKTVEEAEKKILGKLLEKIDKGEIIVNRSGKDEYV